MMTFEAGLIRTCFFPLFSALFIVLRASASTFIRTIYGVINQTVSQVKMKDGSLSSVSVTTLFIQSINLPPSFPIAKTSKHAPTTLLLLSSNPKSHFTDRNSSIVPSPQEPYQLNLHFPAQCVPLSSLLYSLLYNTGTTTTHDFVPPSSHFLPSRTFPPTPLQVYSTSPHLPDFPAPANVSKANEWPQNNIYNYHF